MVSSFAEFDEEVASLIRTKASDDAADLLSDRWPTFIAAHAAELRGLITTLPSEVWGARASLLLALGCSLRAASSSNPFAALPYLDEAEAVMSRDTSGAPELKVLVPLARSAALRGLGQLRDAQAQVAVAEDALSTIDVSLPLRIELQSLVLLQRGICMTHLNKLEEAALDIRHGLALRESLEPDESVIESLGCLALIEYFSGHPTAPDRPLAGTAGDTGVPEVVRISAAPIVIAECFLAIDEGAFGRADELLEWVSSVVPGTEYEVLYLNCRAVVRAATVGVLEALESLQEIQIMLRDWQLPSLAHHLHDAERITSLIDIGEYSAARDAIAALQTDDQHAHCNTRLAARLELLTGDFDGVLRSTAACRALGDKHAPRSLAYVEVLRAAAHHALGDASTAASTLDRALATAVKAGWRRPFTVLPHDRLRPMLDSARERQQSPDALAALEEIYSVCNDSVDSIAPLTSRERMILHHIAAGDTRQEISSQLSVSPNTVKSQVRSIYRKLGATSRHEAIARASKYGISV
jgi:ATP/maltotriose-dependent transcriptional regulator MalT